MIFQSLDFLVFFIGVFALHWLLRPPLRNLFLLAVSYVFYGYVHPWYLILICFETLVVYFCAIQIVDSPAYRRAYLLTAVSLCLGLLGVFKYFHFFVDSAVSAMQSLDIDVSGPVFRIALPVGISFMTFQALAYVIDVYRGEIAPRRNLLHVALFKAFFPQLVAGPIERAQHLMPQLESDRSLTKNLVIDGAWLICWGFFKKLVIADNVAVIANKVFLLEHPAFPILWAGVLAFCFQIFADFSAYTDIARGTAKLLGVNLIENFRHPYLADSPVEFWRRWHISLSTWFRDYVYIPLGGNRGGQLMEARNVMLTFLLSGLWHGAAWNYVAWGAYNGVLIVGYRFLNSLGDSRTRWAWAPRPARIILMFVLINIGWLMFRETNFHYLIRELTTGPFDATALEWQGAGYFTLLTLLYASPLMIHAALDSMPMPLAARVFGSENRQFVTRMAVAAGLFLGILVLQSDTSVDFIYFKF